MFKNEHKERVIADFVAGMTYRYAINLHKKIKGIYYHIIKREYLIV